MSKWEVELLIRHFALTSEGAIYKELPDNKYWELGRERTQPTQDPEYK